MRKEIKRCPFCGNAAITFEPDADRNIVSCSLGHAPMRTIEGWNTRTDVTRQQIERWMRDIVADLEEVRSAMHGHPELTRENYQFLFGKRTALNGVLDRLRVLLSQSERVWGEKGTVDRVDAGEGS